MLQVNSSRLSSKSSGMVQSSPRQDKGNFKLFGFSLKAFNRSLIPDHFWWTIILIIPLAKLNKLEPINDWFKLTKSNRCSLTIVAYRFAYGGINVINKAYQIKWLIHFNDSKRLVNFRYPLVKNSSKYAKLGKIDRLYLKLEFSFYMEWPYWFSD